MRVQNKDISVKKVLFSKVFSLLYFLLAAFFIYKSYYLFPIWSGHYQKNLEIKNEFAEKENLVKDMQEKRENNKTDLGRARYEKEFFNKLDEEEEMIVLYDGEKNKAGETETGENNLNIEKERHMFFWQKWHQNFLVWWKNSDFSN